MESIELSIENMPLYTDNVSTMDSRTLRKSPENISPAYFLAQRARMVEEQLKFRGIKDERVLTAMGLVPREAFIPTDLKRFAYEDGPLPIGHEQTISQPFIVALMTELLTIKSTDKILEIGTGSGYQTAILANLAESVYTIEILDKLQNEAKNILLKVFKGPNKNNIFFKTSDGYQGWKEHAPFDKIILTAAPPKLPQPLIDQLKVGGKIVAPIGEASQLLKVFEKQSDGNLKEIESVGVRFVPMVGEVQNK